MPDRTTSTPVSVYLLFAAAAALAIGSFLPWLTATAPLGLSLSRSGVDDGGDGGLVVLIAIGIGVVAVLASQERSRRVAALVGLVGGIGAGALLLYEAHDISERFATIKASSDLIVTSYGAGLYLCGVGALLAIAGGGMLLDAAKKKPYPSVTSATGEHGLMCPNGHESPAGANFCHACGSSTLEAF